MPLLPLEAWAATKILRTPGSTLSAGLAARSDLLGCSKIRTLNSDCFAAWVRAAVDGHLQWSYWIALLIQTAEMSLRLRVSMIDGAPWPSFWKRPAYVMNSKRAAEGSLVLAPTRVSLAVAGSASAAKAALNSGSFRNKQAAADRFVRDVVYDASFGLVIREQ